MIPNISQLVIYNNYNINSNVDSMIKLKINVIYDLNKNLSNIEEDWILNKNIKFNNDSFILKSELNNILEYSLNFDNSFSFSYDMIKDSNNNDFKIIIGDRSSIVFDNKNIYFVLKEKINDKIQYNKIKLSNDNIKLDNKKLYTISLDVQQNKNHENYIVETYKYVLNITNLDDNLNYSYVFEDNGENKVEYERYKELKLMYNNMNVELKNIIIKGN